MTGLLESGAVKEVPVWYAVYKRFPPPVAPDSNRTLSTKEIREIVYKEDYELAKKPLPEMGPYVTKDLNK